MGVHLHTSYVPAIAYEMRIYLRLFILFEKSENRSQSPNVVRFRAFFKESWSRDCICEHHCKNGATRIARNVSPTDECSRKRDWKKIDRIEIAYGGTIINFCPTHGFRMPMKSKSGAYSPQWPSLTERISRKWLAQSIKSYDHGAASHSWSQKARSGLRTIH